MEGMTCPTCHGFRGILAPNGKDYRRCPQCMEMMCACSVCLDYSGTYVFCPDCRKAGCKDTGPCLCPEGLGGNYDETEEDD